MYIPLIKYWQEITINTAEVIIVASYGCTDFLGICFFVKPTQIISVVNYFCDRVLNSPPKCKFERICYPIGGHTSHIRASGDWALAT